jgi:hypothetical protein
MADEDISSILAELGPPTKEAELAVTGGGVYTGAGTPQAYTSYGSTGDAALGLSRSYLSGLTLGQWPKFEAGVLQPAAETVGSLFGAQYPETTYAQRLKDIETAQAAFGAQAPVASTVTEVVPGMIVNPLGILGVAAKGKTAATAAENLPTLYKALTEGAKTAKATEKALDVVKAAEKAIQTVPGGIITAKGLASVPGQAFIEGAVRAKEDQSALVEGLKSGAFGTAGSVVSNVAGRGLGRLANESDRLKLSAYGFRPMDVGRSLKGAEAKGVKITDADQAPILKNIKQFERDGIIDNEAEALGNATRLGQFQNALNNELEIRLSQANSIVPPIADFNRSNSDAFLSKLSGDAKDEAKKIIEKERSAIINQMNEAEGGSIMDLQRAKVGLNYVWSNKPYAEDVRKAIRADLRQEIENRIALAEFGSGIPKGTAAEIKEINRVWGDAADLKSDFGKIAFKDLGADVVEDAFNSMRTSGGPGTLNIISGVTGNPLPAVIGQILNAARTSEGKQFLSDITADPALQKYAAQAGELLQEYGRGRGFAIAGALQSQRAADKEQKAEAVQDTIIQKLGALSDKSTDKEILDALRGIAKEQKQQSKTTAPELQRTSGEPADVRKLILDQDAITQAIISAESKGNPKAKSAKDAVGLMQLLKGTASDLRVADRTDPAENVRGGKQYYQQLLSKYDGDKSLALAAYNWGMGNVDKALAKVKRSNRTPTYDNVIKYAAVPSETVNYVDYVLKQEKKITADPQKYWNDIFKRRKQVEA